MLPYPNLEPHVAIEELAEKLMVTGIDGLPHGPMFEPVHTGNLDFTNPRTVDSWQEMLTHAARDQAWDGWMEDFGEYVDDTDHLAAGDGTRLSEVYPLLYHKITTRIVQALNPNIVSFSRSGFIGTQQWSPMLWGGDQSAQLDPRHSASPPPSPRVSPRACPVTQPGDQISSATVTRPRTMDTLGRIRSPDPRHAGSSLVQAQVRGRPLARSRERSTSSGATPSCTRRLLPYFATYAAEAHRTGVPILRHLVLEYPEDPRSATAEYQYLLGDRLLVAPVIEQGAANSQTLSPKRELAELLDRRPSHWRSGRDRPRSRSTRSLSLSAPAPSSPSNRKRKPPP